MNSEDRDDLSRPLFGNDPLTITAPEKTMDVNCLSQSSPAEGFPWESCMAMGSFLAYVYSLFLPAFRVATGNTYDGFLTLVFGWLFIFVTGESLFFRLAWWANPLLVVALTCFLTKRAGMTCIFAFASVVLSAGFLLVEETQLQGAGGLVLIDIGVGYIVWVMSMILALASGLMLYRKKPASFGPRHWDVLISMVICGTGYIVLGLLIARTRF